MPPGPPNPKAMMAKKAAENVAGNIAENRQAKEEEKQQQQQEPEQEPEPEPEQQEAKTTEPAEPAEQPKEETKEEPPPQQQQQQGEEPPKQEQQQGGTAGAGGAGAGAGAGAGSHEKTPEELQREREKAMEQLNDIIKTNQPKNLRQGLSSGVGNILTGCVGGAGIAIIAPLGGGVAGLSAGGPIGGALGLAGGAIVGALGGAAMAVAGVTTGLMQMGRGVIAVPEAIMAPRQGKWWNENEGEWILTDLGKEAEKLESVPADDNDILGDLEKELDDNAAKKKVEGEGDAKTAKDPYYYEVLDVPTDADSGTIKRRYYVLARKYHPDKVGADDKESADKFKEVAEAYQVLSDPDLRKKYDTDGRKGLSADKTDVSDGPHRVDPYILFAFLFGSDRFDDYVGRLAAATSANVGDSPKVSLKDAKTLQQRRAARLAIKLAAKVEPWAEGSDSAKDVEESWKKEAADLSTASFGHQMVTTIGKAYNAMAVMYQGSIETGQGLPKLSEWAAGVKAGGAKSNEANENKKQQLFANLDMMKLQAKMQEEMQKAKTDEEKAKIVREHEDAKIEITLTILWTMTVVDITATLLETTNMVFFDQAVDKETRMRRSKAVAKLGKIWMDCPAPAKEGSDEKNAKQLYEDATLAAMIETIKRKDEAAYQHGGTSSSSS